MTKKITDPELQFPLKSWRFWLIIITILLYLADTFVQWFVFKSYFESITSALLVLILGYEAYSRIHHKKTYIGKKYTTILSVILIAILAFLYLWVYQLPY